jgi:hypothetical protein
VPSEPLISQDVENARNDSEADKIDITVEKTRASLSSTDPRNNRSAASSARLRKSSSLALHQSPLLQDAGRARGTSKTSTSETAPTISSDSSLGRGTPKSRHSRIPRSSQASSSSPLESTSTNQVNAQGGNRIKGVTAKMVKAKKSVRDLFKRGEKSTKTPESATPSAPKQGFMSGTRSSLAKVIRDSKSLSKVSLSLSKRAGSRQETRLGSSASKVSVDIPPVPALPITARPSTTVVPKARKVRSSPPDPKTARQSAQVARKVRKIISLPSAQYVNCQATSVTIGAPAVSSGPPVPDTAHLSTQAVRKVRKARSDLSGLDVKRQSTPLAMGAPVSSGLPVPNTARLSTPVAMRAPAASSGSSVPDTARPSTPAFMDAPAVPSGSDIRRASVLTVPEAPSASTSQENPSTRIDAAGVAVLNILKSAESLPKDAAERLRAMEIAEVSTLRSCARRMRSRARRTTFGY